MLQEIIALSQKSITLERNEFLKVKGSIDTNIYFVEIQMVVDEYY